MHSDSVGVHCYQAAPTPIWGKERANLVFFCTRPWVAAAEPPPDELEQAEVAGGQLVVAALTLEREHLDRPRPDARNRKQATPRMLVIGIV